MENRRRNRQNNLSFKTPIHCRSCPNGSERNWIRLIIPEAERREEVRWEETEKTKAGMKSGIGKCHAWAFLCDLHNYNVLPPATNLVRWNLSSDAKCRYGKSGTPKHTMQLLKSIRLIHLEAQWGFENHPRCDKQVITIVDLRQPAITNNGYISTVIYSRILDLLNKPKLDLTC